MALACPVCFGASDAPMAVGMNWGVLTLLGITVLVLGGCAAFFVNLVRRDARSAGGQTGESFPGDGLHAAGGMTACGLDAGGRP